MDSIPTTRKGRRLVPNSAARLVTALALCQFMALMDRSLLAALLTPIKIDLGLTDTQLGLLQGTGFALFYALAIVPAGLLADRIDRRRLVLGGVALWSLGVLGYALAPNFRWVFASSLMVGLGQSVLLPSALSLIAERVAAQRRARSTSVFTAAGLAGRAAALIGGGLLLGLLSGSTSSSMEPWRVVVLASLAFNLAAALALATARDDEAERTRSSRRHGVMLGQALRWMAASWRTYVLLLVLLSATVLAIQGVAAWTPALLNRRFALEPPTAALLAGTVTILAGVAGHILGGWATDAAISVRGVSGGFGVAAATLALALPGLLLFAACVDLATSLSGLVLFACSMGAATPAGLTLLQSVTQTPAKGTVSGLMLAATTLCGLGLGPVLIGLVSDRGGVGGDVLGSAAIQIVLPVLTIGTLAALASIRHARTQGRPA